MASRPPCPRRASSSMGWPICLPAPWRRPSGWRRRLIQKRRSYHADPCRRSSPGPCPVVPFPRPACAKDEALAGLTPGDHLALAVARWGDPIAGVRAPCPALARIVQHSVLPAVWNCWCGRRETKSPSFTPVSPARGPYLANWTASACGNQLPAALNSPRRTCPKPMDRRAATIATIVRMSSSPITGADASR